jgi:hypothetical protein
VTIRGVTKKPGFIRFISPKMGLSCCQQAVIERAPQKLITPPDCCVGWCSKSSRTPCTLRFVFSIRLALRPLTTLFRNGQKKPKKTKVAGREATVIEYEVRRKGFALRRGKQRLFEYLESVVEMIDSGQLPEPQPPEPVSPHPLAGLREASFRPFFMPVAFAHGGSAMRAGAGRKARFRFFRQRCLRSDDYLWRSLRSFSVAWRVSSDLVFVPQSSSEYI